VKRALITGIGGQDGAYLARFLLRRGYRVWGTLRALEPARLWRLSELGIGGRLELRQLALEDAAGLAALLAEARPHEVYNLAGLSQVSLSFREPAATVAANALGASRLLEAVRAAWPEARVYQASSSEMYGRAAELPQRESTAFHPVSPYGAAKLYAHWITVTYREAYGLFACSGILFNHESPLRDEAFVTRKIAQGLVRLRQSGGPPLRLGNLAARRDWGYAEDYVQGMWLMLQQEQADDYLLATGMAHAVSDFVEQAATTLGFAPQWSQADGITRAHDAASGRLLVETDPALARPLDIDEVRGDASKAAARLGWRAAVRFDTLVEIMVQAELRRLAEAA